MSLQFLDANLLGNYMSAAWKKNLNTNEDPANGQWYTNGANNDNVGLYGGLTDQLDTELYLDKASQRYLPQQIIATSSIIDNQNGLNPASTVTLEYSFTNTVSSTHTTTEALKIGESYSINFKDGFVIAGTEETLTFNIDLEWSWSESTTRENTTQQTFSQSVPVAVPAGKVYKAVLTATAQQLQVPYKTYVHVSGNTETWFEDRIQGHYNWSVDAGTMFSWINMWGEAGSDSSSYGADPGNPSQGVVVVNGTLTAQQTVDFKVLVYDITGQSTAADSSARTVTSFAAILPGAPLVHQITFDNVGARVHAEGAGELYLIDVDGTRRHIPDPDTYNKLFRDWNNLQVVDLSTIPSGPDLTSGAYLATAAQGDGRVYLVSNGQKRLVSSPAVMDKFYFSWNQIQQVPESTLGPLPDGTPLT